MAIATAIRLAIIETGILVTAIAIITSFNALTTMSVTTDVGTAGIETGIAILIVAVIALLDPPALHTITAAG